ncbi:hypothetical protein [Stenotrophomonas hibiscicola]|uniref:hypothetical protein n=1 Tax=Stenotrophomonas hibiscicola TaxID=86189 RepID=UPI003D09CA70
MQTAGLRGCKATLAKVNDQLCFHFFAAQQAGPAINQVLAEHPDRFVTESFPGNSFAPRINIRNKILPDFQKSATETLGGVALVFATECLLSYCDEIQSLRSEVVPTIHDVITHKKQEEQLSEKLTHWGAPPPVALTKSFAYLRLRRNHIAHANQDPHQSLKELTKNYGNMLSTYWGQQPTKLPGLSFASQDFSVGSEQEAFSLLNLCRVVMEKYDDLLCQTIPQSAMETFALRCFILSNKHLRGRSLSDRHRKFAYHFKLNFGVDLAMTEAEFDCAWANA